MVQDVLKSNESVKSYTGIASLSCFILLVNRPFHGFWHYLGWWGGGGGADTAKFTVNVWDFG